MRAAKQRQVVQSSVPVKTAGQNTKVVPLYTQSHAWNPEKLAFWAVRTSKTELPQDIEQTYLWLLFVPYKLHIILSTFPFNRTK